MKDAPEPPEISSTFLLDVLEGRDAEEDLVNATAEREAARLVRAITQKVLNSRQKLVDLPIESLDELMSFRRAGTWLPDDFYCHGVA